MMRGAEGWWAVTGGHWTSVPNGQSMVMPAVEIERERERERERESEGEGEGEGERERGVEPEGDSERASHLSGRVCWLISESSCSEIENALLTSSPPLPPPRPSSS